MDTIGKRLKYAKDKKGLTNKELAKLMGKNSPSTVISWENDTVELTVSQIKQLASILDVSVNYLMEGEKIQNVVNEPVSDYILISKDELINLQKLAIQNQSQQIQNQSQQIENQNKSIENLKNIDVVVPKQ